MNEESPVTPKAETAAAVPPPPDHIHRGRIGVNVALQVLLGFLLFVAVNYIANRRWKQWDFTYDRNFTLADTTVKFLGEIKEPVRVTVLTPRDLELEQDLQPLLDQYSKNLGPRLKAEFIDTRRDTEAWEHFSTSQKSGMALPPRAEGVMVQAVNPHKTPEGAEKYFYKWIPQEAFYLRDSEKNIALAFRGESLLNTALAEVTEPERPLAGIAAGIGFVNHQPDPSNPGKTWSHSHVISSVCSTQNIELEPWLALQEPEIMPRFRCIVFAATTIFGEQQQQDLTHYFETPGNSLLVLLDPEHESQEMNNWLKNYGVEVRADRVLHARSTAAGPIKHFAVDVRFQPGSDITRGLESRTTILPGQTRSLQLLTELDKVKNENIVLTPLLQPGPDFWGETQWTQEMPLFDRGEDAAQPLSVAVAVERGASPDPRLQVQSSRMVVVGNIGLCMPPAASQNFDFLARSMNWLLHREEAAPNDSSTDKARSLFAIAIKPPQWKRVLIICTGVLPLAALMTGLLIWSTRRT
jgi:hypothetical protein